MRLDRNAQEIENQADCTREVLSKSIDASTQAFENLTRQSQFNRLCDRLTDSEFRNGDRLRDLDREIQANAREAAKCCCETQKQIAQVEAKLSLQACEDKAQIIAEIKAVESRNVERELNAANAELTALKTQIACGCCNTPPRN